MTAFPNPVNVTFDLSVEELASIEAASLTAGMALRTATAGTVAAAIPITADEVTAVALLWRALRGRAVEQPMRALLKMYHESGFSHSNPDLMTLVGASYNSWPGRRTP